MNKTNTAFIAIILACAMSYAQTSQPQATTQPESIETLITDLGSDAFAVREAAQKKIVGLGQAATQPVQELLKSTKDPEVQQRASAILAQITDADYSRGSRVTLHFKKTPAMEVY